MIKLGRASLDSVSLRVSTSPAHSPSNSEVVSGEHGTASADNDVSAEPLDGTEKDLQNSQTPADVARTPQPPQSLSIAERVASSSTYPEKVAGLLLTMACSDSIVKNSLTQTNVLGIVVECSRSLGSSAQLMILAGLKQLSDEPDFA